MKKYMRILRSIINLIRADRAFVKENGYAYFPIRKYKTIEGFLTDKEAKLLFDLAKSLKKDAIAVEIGSWLGKSTYCIAKGLGTSSNKSKLYCIDPFNADGDFYSKPIYESVIHQKKLSAKEMFLTNMKNFNLLSMVNILEGYSTDFSAGFKEKIDFLFIDANHSYEAVLTDFQDWAPKIRPGGIIAFHDVEFDPKGDPSGNEVFTGPGLVVKENIVNNPAWKDMRLVDGLFCATKVN
jgi:predicted O-methyltransferase YrrM